MLHFEFRVIKLNKNIFLLKNKEMKQGNEQQQKSERKVFLIYIEKCRKPTTGLSIIDHLCDAFCW